MKNQNVMYSILTRIIKLVLAVIAVLLIYMGALVTYDFGYRIFAEKPMAAGDGKEYIIESINTDDDELEAFLFSLGCYSGEPITVISRRRGGCIVSIKDGRYSIDNQLAAAIKLEV